jgi:hypothetical protein
LSTRSANSLFRGALFVRWYVPVLVLVIAVIVTAVILGMLPGTGRKNGGPDPVSPPAGREPGISYSNYTTAAIRAPAIAVPKTMTVYRVVNGTDADRAEAIMRSLGFSGVIDERNGTFYSAGDPDDFFINQSTGVLFYNDNRKGDRPIPEDRYELLPSGDEAVLVARDFLVAKDLWPADAVLQKQRMNLNEIGMSANGTIVTGNGLTQVDFARVMNGTPVFGDFIRVEIGAGGEVVRVSRQWRAVEPVGIVPVASMSNAYEELVGRGIFGEPGNISPDTVDLVQLGYAEENPGYLVPVYAFFGTRTVRNTTRAFSELVPAALVPV